MSVRPAVYWGYALVPRERQFETPGDLHVPRPNSGQLLPRPHHPRPQSARESNCDSPRFGVRHPGIVSGRARFHIDPSIRSDPPRPASASAWRGGGESSRAVEEIDPPAAVSAPTYSGDLSDHKSGEASGNGFTLMTELDADQAAYENSHAYEDRSSEELIA